MPHRIIDKKIILIPAHSNSECRECGLLIHDKARAVYVTLSPKGWRHVTCQSTMREGGDR